MLAFVTEWLKKPIEPGDIVRSCVWDRVSLWTSTYKEIVATGYTKYARDLECAFSLAKAFDSLASR